MNDWWLEDERRYGKSPWDGLWNYYIFVTGWEPLGERSVEIWKLYRANDNFRFVYASCNESRGEKSSILCVRTDVPMIERAMKKFSWIIGYQKGPEHW
jgi:hypothetical protein